MEELKVELRSETTQFIIVRLGDEQYGIAIKYVDNIVRMQHITRVPKVQSYLKGVINLRGEVIPVMSIRIKMGLEPDQETKSSRIIILKLGMNGLIGIIVDEVKEVVTLESDQIEKIAYDSKDDKDSFLWGVGKCAGGLISLLDLNSVVLENL